MDLESISVSEKDKYDFYVDFKKQSAQRVKDSQKTPLKYREKMLVARGEVGGKRVKWIKGIKRALT